MIYVHYCKTCRRIYLLAGHPPQCPKCGESITELKVGYRDYSAMTPYERESLRVHLENPVYLQEYSKSYRFAKRTKRYLEGQNPQDT